MNKALVSLCILSTAFAMGGCTRNITHGNASVTTPAEPKPSPESVKRSHYELALINGSKLDHKTRALGVINSANTFNQHLQEPVLNFMRALDKNGDVSLVTPAAITVSIDNASSDHRCFYEGMMGKCIVRIQVDGTIFKNGKSTPFSLHNEGEPTTFVTDSSHIAGTKILDELKKRIKAAAYN